MVNVRHVTSGSKLFRKFQAVWILLDRVYITTHRDNAALKMRGWRFSSAALLEIHAVWDVNAASVGRQFHALSSSSSDKHPTKSPPLLILKGKILRSFAKILTIYPNTLRNIPENLSLHFTLKSVKCQSSGTV